MKRKTAAIILAAGKGTRMNSDKPKVIFKLAGEALINRVVDTALKVNSDPIAVVVGHKKDLVIEIIPENKKIVFVQQIPQKGTGHAVMVTRETFRDFEGDIFILCGDVPLLRSETLHRMHEHHKNSGSACTVLTSIMEDPKQYGRIVRDKTGNVSKIVEYKDASETQRKIKEINTGIYCFDAYWLFKVLSRIDNKNSQEEYYLTDTLELLNKSNQKIETVILEDMLEASGVNSINQLENLEKEYLKRQEKQARRKL